MSAATARRSAGKKGTLTSVPSRVSYWPRSNRHLRLLPPLVSVDFAGEVTGAISGELGSERIDLVELLERLKIPFGPVIGAALIGAVIVIDRKPIDAPCRAAHAEIFVFQTRGRRHQKLIGPAVEGVQGGKRRLHALRAVAFQHLLAELAGYAALAAAQFG